VSLLGFVGPTVGVLSLKGDPLGDPPRYMECCLNTKFIPEEWMTWGYPPMIHHDFGDLMSKTDQKGW